MNSIRKNKAFTLIEVLTSISVISFIMAIMFPCMNGARKTANSIICLTNIKATGLAFNAYCESNDGLFPPAYTYISSDGGSDQPEEPVNGINHWSGNLIADNYLTEESLHCPEIRFGGLSPRNTEQSNLDQNQISDKEDIIDIQAKRCAFTVNESICPRNRFELGFDGATRASRLVNNVQINRPAKLIMLTEWPKNWQVVSGPNTQFSKSYMPIHGFRGLGQMAGADRYDLNMLEPDSSNLCSSYGYVRKVNEYDLSTEPNIYRRYPPRLDWIGRNHNGSKTDKNMKKSSFCYVDGHAESKSVYKTILNDSYEWGNRVYSLTGANRAKRY